MLLILSSLSSAFDVTTSRVLVYVTSAALLLDEANRVKENIDVSENKTTNIFFITCSPSVSWMFCFCCYMYHIEERLKQIVIYKNETGP